MKMPGVPVTALEAWATAYVPEYVSALTMNWYPQSAINRAIHCHCMLWLCW